MAITSHKTKQKPWICNIVEIQPTTNPMVSNTIVVRVSTIYAYQSSPLAYNNQPIILHRLRLSSSLPLVFLLTRSLEDKSQENEEDLKFI